MSHYSQRRRADRPADTGLLDEVIDISVHTKVTKGGRNLRFGALVTVGNGAGRVGVGYGKARGVPMAIEKANKAARRAMLTVPLVGDTVPHDQMGRHKASEVLIKPAAPGTGVKAGATVRAIMNVLGVRNVLTKSLGRNNPINLARAVMDALGHMNSAGDVEALRGKSLRVRHPQLDPARKRKAPPAPETAGQEAAPAQPQAQA